MLLDARVTKICCLATSGHEFPLGPRKPLINASIHSRYVLKFRQILVGSMMKTAVFKGSFVGEKATSPWDDVFFWTSPLRKRDAAFGCRRLGLGHVLGKRLRTYGMAALNMIVNQSVSDINLTDNDHEWSLYIIVCLGRNTTESSQMGVPFCHICRNTTCLKHNV